MFLRLRYGRQIGSLLDFIDETGIPQGRFMKTKADSLRVLYFRSPLFRPSKGDTARFAVLEAALKCLTTQGVLELSFQNVAAELKMRRSHVVYYYPTIGDLMTDLLRTLLSIGQDITVAHLSVVKDPNAMLEAYVEATFLWFQMYPDHAGVLFLFNHLAAVDPSQRAFLTSMRESAEARIAEILTRQVRKKPNKAWAAARATDIRSLIMGQLLNHFTTNSRVSYAALEQQTIAAVRGLASAN